MLTSTCAHLELFPVTSKGYTLLSELGVGATCKVYRAHAHLNNGNTVEVAVKIMDLARTEDWDTVFKEVSLMRSMRHENIVQIITCFNEKDQLWIVMPLLEGGSMRVIMQTLCPGGFTSEPIIAAILQGALAGLAYMHKNNYIHRDVKAGNILLSSTGVPQLADFGVAATTTNDVLRKAHTFTGTPCWMAPEVISQDQAGYGPSADIWSLGITALELAFGYPPYARLLPLKAMMETLEGDPPTPETYGDVARTKELSKEFRRFVERALQKDVRNRATAAELLQDPFIKKAASKQTLVEAIIQRLPSKHLESGVLPHLGQVLTRPEEDADPDRGDDGSAVPCSRFIFDDDEDTVPRRKAMAGFASQLTTSEEAAAAAAASILAEDDTVEVEQAAYAPVNAAARSPAVETQPSQAQATSASQLPTHHEQPQAQQPVQPQPGQPTEAVTVAVASPPSIPLPPTPDQRSPTSSSRTLQSQGVNQSQSILQQPLTQQGVPQQDTQLQQDVSTDFAATVQLQTPEEVELSPEEQQRLMQVQWDALTDEGRQQLAPLVAKVQAIEVAAQSTATEEEYLALCNERQTLAAYLRATLQTRAAERQAVASAMRAHELQQAQSQVGVSPGPSPEVVEHCRLVLLRVQQELIQLRNTLYGSPDNDILALLSNRMAELRALQEQYMGFFELLQQQQQQQQQLQQQRPQQ